MDEQEYLENEKKNVTKNHKGLLAQCLQLLNVISRGQPCFAS